MVQELARKRKQLYKLTHRQRLSQSLTNGHAQTNEDEDEDQDHQDQVDEDETNTIQVASAVPKSPETPTLQKVKFVVRPPKATIMTRDNIPLPTRFPSLEQFLDHDPEAAHTSGALGLEQIQIEARMRLRVQAARKRGGLLDHSSLQARPDPQKQPPRQYTHYDHLLGHVFHFGKLLKQEHRDHVRVARDLAYEAKRFVETKAQTNRVMTAEEIEDQKRLHMRGLYRSVVRDLVKLWASVEIYVVDMRSREQKKQEDEENTRKLDQTLHKTERWLDASMRHGDSNAGSGTEEDSDAASGSSGIDSSDSENMSDSDSTRDSDEDKESRNGDEEMTQEQLLAKYGSVPELSDKGAIASVSIETAEQSQHESNTTKDRSPPASRMEPSSPLLAASSPARLPKSNVEAEESNGMDESEDAPGALNSQATRAMRDASTQGSVSQDDALDSSDHSTTMDSEEDFTSGEEDDDDEEGGESEENSDSDGRGLNSLFTRKERVQIRETYHPDIDSDEEQMAGRSPELVAEDLTLRAASEAILDASAEVDNMDLDDDPTSREISTQASPRTSVTKVSEPESTSSIEPRVESTGPDTPDEVKSRLRTAVPHLFRGTLRTYQHEGLDWLADLYARGRNGILADEMGLGKTIQTIALLAHLAVDHEVWGPHLVIVPTSVMLNWEMEFKKFFPGFKVLTYYGTQQERAEKRRGWMAQNAFNVCITSYQLILQDQNVFKRRPWHYMILDEAHNIKNFSSQRWQVMMTFNTRARLLLTGTPLQNNIEELWSLMYFVRYDPASDEEDGFAGLAQFQGWFKKSADLILEHGRGVLSEQDKQRIEKLHKVIRPFLLRRLKKDVEKQMPLKYEHVELCRLSKRQRQLYDGFMSRAATRETLSSGNYLSIINALMQLRKVCNHPDLFETRPITTSLALPRSVAQDWQPHEFFVRRLLDQEGPQDRLDLSFLQLCPISREDISANEVMERLRLFNFSNNKFLQVREIQRKRHNSERAFSASSPTSVMESLKDIRKADLLDTLDRTMYIDTYRHRGRPLIGRALLKEIAFGTTYEILSRSEGPTVLPRIWDSALQPVPSHGLVQSVETRSRHMEPLVQRFACVTPPVTISSMLENLLPQGDMDLIRSSSLVQERDPFHEARIRLSIAFPDKRLLQYDCGKLQRLDRLLRQLSAGGHRALIFTQMTKVLDLLEQFLNIHGHRYLRLDGATKIEQRQILTDRFNNDQRILCFILSSRSGGLGINLTGADTVIFYDLDWNPAMDKQCTDRAHRIGQTRDVHIYRFVSEHTIEANILRKASQKLMLDDVVIQDGQFTPDFFNPVSGKNAASDEGAAMASAAMDRILGNEETQTNSFDAVEEKEDVAAAKVATMEDRADDRDWVEGEARIEDGAGEQNIGPYAATNAALAETQDNQWTRLERELRGTIDGFMIQLMKRMVKDVPLDGADKLKKARKKRKGDPHLKPARK